MSPRLTRGRSALLGRLRRPWLGALGQWPAGDDAPAEKPGWQRVAESWGAWNIPGEPATVDDVVREAVYVAAYRAEQPERDGELRATADMHAHRPLDLLWLEALAGAGFDDLARGLVGLSHDPAKRVAQFRALGAADRGRAAHIAARTAASMLERADAVRTDAQRAAAKAATEAAIAKHLEALGPSAVGTTGGFHEARRLLDARATAAFWTKGALVLGALLGGAIVVSRLIPS